MQPGKRQSVGFAPPVCINRALRSKIIDLQGLTIIRSNLAVDPRQCRIVCRFEGLLAHRRTGIHLDHDEEPESDPAAVIGFFMP